MASPDTRSSSTLYILVGTFARGVYIFALAWLISFVMWWPIAIPLDRLIYWVPQFLPGMSDRPELFSLLWDLAGAIFLVPLMLFFLIGGVPVAVVTALAMTAVLYAWPSVRGTWRSALAGVVAALLVAPIAYAYSIHQTPTDGPGVNVERLWHLFILIGYPIGCAVGGYRIGKPVTGSPDAPPKRSMRA